MYIALLFRAGNLEATLKSNYVYPFIEIFFRAYKSRAGTAVILATIIVVDVGLVISVVAASSRMLWSFARDRGFPFWTYVRRV